MEKILSGSREFEEMFPFEETEDQMMAIEAVKKRYGKPQDHGPSGLWRCRIRKNRSCDPCGIQSSTGE